MWRLLLACLLAGPLACCTPRVAALPQPMLLPLQAPGEPAGAWIPPEPDPAGFDWVQLTSGEWLKGEIKVLRRDVLEFESEELDTLEFDWEDVAVLRSVRVLSVVHGGNKVERGTVLVRDGRVAVGETPIVFAREELESIAPWGKRERSFWSGKVSLSSSVRAGNTDQNETSAYVFLRRRSTFHRLESTYKGAFGKVNGEENVNSHSLQATWDYFLSRRFYVKPLVADVYRDPIQNIAVRAIPGAGAGYTIIDRPKTRWDLEVGGAYRYTRYDSVEAGQDEADRSAITFLSSTFEADLTKKIELKVTYNVQIGIPDTAATDRHLFVSLSFDLWKNLDLDLTFSWDHIGAPQADEGGIVPEPDDYSVSVGLGWEF